MSEFKRPDSIPYPQIYCEFDGKVQNNGKQNKYWIQDLTEEYYEPVIKHYTTEFMDDEPLCKYSNSTQDPVCLEEFSEIWRILLGQKISLICLTKNENEEIQIAGFNCLYAHCKHERESQYKSRTTKRIVDVLVYFESQRNVFEEFNCDKYLTAMGLFVCRDFRGEGLGQKILATRDQIGKSMGFKVGLTVFTSPISQKQAERAGFKDYFVMSYEDLGKIKNEFIFPGIEKESKVCRLMYKEYI